jgi:hypothetical protein
MPATASSSDESPLDGRAGELVSVITVRECATLVVPSQGKQVLGMGLEDMVKGLQVVEEGGRDRGEDRMPGEYVIGLADSSQHGDALHHAAPC